MKIQTREKLKRISSKVLSEMFPEEFLCLACGEEIFDASHNNLCEKCLKKLVPIKNACKTCGQSLNDFDEYCQTCKTTKRIFDKNVSVFDYEDLPKNMVYRLKYGCEKFMAKVMSNYMLEKFKETYFGKIDFVLPVPLSAERMSDRGFNQAEILSKLFCDKLNLELVTNNLIRVKNTQTQTHLNEKERRENLKNAFAVLDKEKLKGKNVLVIDDIFTTGSTMNEISKILKTSGVAKVFGLTFCHTKGTKYYEQK